MQTREILNIVNDHLSTCGKENIRSGDKLYSSGLLDSIEMFELLVILERNGVRLKTQHTNVNMRLPLEKYDTVEKIVDCQE